MIAIVVNGRRREVDAPPETALLHVLRGELGLNGPKYGCGQAQCGACSVLVGQAAVRACITPLAAVEGQSIRTLEGLGDAANPSRLQRAFIEVQALQCGYCTNGMIVQAQALLETNPHPTDAEIRAGMEPILCRCGSHMRVLRAIKRAAERP